MDGSKIDNSGIFGSSMGGKGHRIFINGINSLIGQAIFEELRNDHIAIHTGETPNRFFGTLNQKDIDTIPVPSQSIKILISKSKPRTFRKQVASCDIFILNLMDNNDYEEVEYVLKFIKSPPTEEYKQYIPANQTVIVLSSVMTWLNTPKKLKKHFPRAKADDSDIEEELKQKRFVRDDESDSENEGKDPLKRVPESEKVLYFTDSDYQQRVPPPRYQQVKNLENLALSLQKTNKSSNLKVHVICSGLLYGNGESNNVFYEFFRRAWLSLHQDLASLPIIGEGKNRIPTIHVTDLARSIKYAIQNKGLQQQYLIAVDCAIRQTQKKIMKAISAGMGSGLVKHVDLDEVVDEDWSEYLALDLKLKASDVFRNATFWHNRAGIRKSTMPLLNQEFNLYRGLFPLKVLITGPPASGKTHYSQYLAQAYGVPHLKIHDLVQMGYKLQDSMGEEIRRKAEEIKDQIVADYDKTKKKKDPELDRNTIKVRLPDEILYKLVKLQMNTAACRNKGFILDGYPRNIHDAKSIFLDKAVDGQDHSHIGDGEDQSSYPGYQIDESILPQYVIVLQADDASLKQRVKDLPIEKTQDTHFNDQAMDRRLKLYREQNQHDSGTSVQCFFTQYIGQENVKVIQSQEEESVNIQKLQTFIEKNGKPCCLNLITEKDIKFLKQIERDRKKAQIEKSSASIHNNEESKQHQQQDDKKHLEDDDDEDEVTKIIRREEEDARRREQEEKERKQRELLEQEQKRVKDEQDRIKLEQIRQQERDLLDTRSQPIRQYLMDNVVPHLTQGLIELCKKVPQEPGEFLAEFLLKKADEIDQQRIQEREAAIKAKLEAKAAKQQQH